MNHDYFEALVKDRMDSAKTFEKPSMRGILAATSNGILKEKKSGLIWVSFLDN